MTAHRHNNLGLRIWAHQVVLLPCVVLIDLAIYVTVALQTSGDQWMDPLPENILTDVTGL